MHPRDGAGSVTLSKGTGPLVRLVAMDDEMWGFKQDGLHRIIPPDVVDPKRLNASLPTQTSFDTEFGASDPTVARLFLQPTDMLHVVFSDQSREPKGLRRALFELCSSVKSAAKAYDGLSSRLRATKIEAVDHKPGAFRTVEVTRAGTLLPEVEALLGHLKRSIQATINLPSFLLGTQFTGKPNVDGVRKELTARYGSADGLVLLFDEVRDELVRMIDVRNGSEHPRTGYRTTVTDWHLGAEGKPVEPTLHFEREGAAVRLPLNQFLIDSISIVVEFAEQLFLWCMDKQECPGVRCGIEEINDIDPTCPIRYRAVLYLKPPAPRDDVGRSMNLRSPADTSTGQDEE